MARIWNIQQPKQIRVSSTTEAKKLRALLELNLQISLVILPTEFYQQEQKMDLSEDGATDPHTWVQTHGQMDGTEKQYNPKEVQMIAQLNG